LTGGIGSGKSTVAALFARFGAPIVDTDQIARELVAPGQTVLRQIQQAFGDSVLQADGTLDRAALRARVFACPTDRQALEAILHPLIRQVCQERVASLQAAYVIIVVPLLVENREAYAVDRIAVVDCPESLQIERVMSRDGLSEAQVRAILASQTTRQARLQAADDLIDNSNSLGALAEPIKNLHNFYLSLSGFITP